VRSRRKETVHVPSSHSPGKIKYLLASSAIFAQEALGLELSIVIFENFGVAVDELGETYQLIRWR
jgi:hypothetical protein